MQFLCPQKETCSPRLLQPPQNPSPSVAETEQLVEWQRRLANCQ